ncbi:HAD family phosphatase [Candidatus Woesearchaeota archaeon]|nr:HAD family phosphatase [Candidatus Woesearchaeota archaeon]
MRFKLIIFDMDGVIFQHDNFWMQLHEALGTLHPGIELTEKYLKKDIKKLAEEVIGKLWKNKPVEPYFNLIKNAKYNPGAKETIKKLKQFNIKTCILTSGPIHLAQRAKEELGIDCIYGNELLIKDNKFTGEYKWLFLQFNHKGEFVKKICKQHSIDPLETIVVGDNEQDIYKFKVAGRSIAFNSKSKELKKAADFIVESNNLKEVLKFIE